MEWGRIQDSPKGRCYSHNVPKFPPKNMTLRKISTNAPIYGMVLTPFEIADN